MVRSLPNDESGSMLSVVTVNLLRVSFPNRRWRRDLMSEEDCSPIINGVSKAEKGVVLVLLTSMGDPPKVVLG